MRLLLVATRGVEPELAARLSSQGCDLQSVDDAAHALDVSAATRAAQDRFDAIVLAAGDDGLELIARLRAAGEVAPILLLTRDAGSALRVAALDRGADDVVRDTVDFAELLARVRALHRRDRPSTGPRRRIADLEIDSHGKAASRAGRPLSLSFHELAVLDCLWHHRGQAVAVKRIVEWVYEGAEPPDSNVIARYIAALRRKIDDGQERKLIHTVRGFGYMLSDRE